MTADDRRGDSSEGEDFLKGSISLYKGTDTKKQESGDEFCICAEELILTTLTVYGIPVKKK